MDSFIEYMIARKSTPIIKLKKFLIYLAALVISFFIFPFMLISVELSSMLSLLFVGVFFIAYRLTCSFNIEYEYILTNGELDIDVITHKKRRKRILTIQDISCVGQCSLTVALPILSACGMETCILPSAILSTHTAGFSGFTFRDLTDDIPAIQKHWQKEGIQFSAIYTGYLGSLKQIGYVKNILETMGTADCVRVVDPAMADNGQLYSIFDMDYVEGMKELLLKLRFIREDLGLEPRMKARDIRSE